MLRVPTRARTGHCTLLTSALTQALTAAARIVSVEQPPGQNDMIRPSATTEREDPKSQVLNSNEPTHCWRIYIYIYIYNIYNIYIYIFVCKDKDMPI